MKKTGATKIETRKLVAEIEKQGKKTKQKIFTVIAEQLSKARRQQIAVNIGKLGKISEANNKKILVVPGKVLSSGNATAGMQVAAMKFSSAAKQKILDAKGKAITLKELLEGKQKASEMILVK